MQSPPTGRYQLQVLHSSDYIADAPDLTGLIVWKSEPIWMQVEQRGGAERSIAALPLFVLLSLASLIAGGAALWRWRRGPADVTPRGWLGGRDLLALALVTALTAGWLLDLRRLGAEAQRLQPDSEAQWTLKLAP